MRFLLLGLLGLSLASCDQKSNKLELCGSSCQAKSSSTELSCKLSPPEMRERKETVLASLKKQVIERKSLTDGYAFKFKGDDKVLDELTEFIKTERRCCDFFTFNLSVSGDQKIIWMEIRGVEGAKEFIDGELAF